MKPAIGLLLLALACAPSWAPAQGTCGPSPLGEPCAQGGVASAGNTEPSLQLGIGNPIHLATGNKYQKETDLPAGPWAPGIEIVRHYNAQDRRPSWLGAGWQLSYDTRLRRVGRRWQIEQADGSRVVFLNSHATSAIGHHGSLSSQGGLWVWAWPNGRRLTFNAQGYLVGIHHDGQLHVDIQREPPGSPLEHAITRISNRRGIALTFAYDIADGQRRLRHIDTPIGRFSYLHQPGQHALRLAAVLRPDGMQRRYLYEAQRQAGNDHALTGIEIVSDDQQHQRRLNTWAYDAQGRAILSIAGPPDSTAQKLSLQYLRSPETPSGLTAVHGAQGRETRFITAAHGQRLRLTEISSRACPACPLSRSGVRYDQAGRLTELDGTLLQRDQHGVIRSLQIADSGWPGLVLNYQAGGAMHSWQSTLTGMETTAYNRAHRPVRRDYANGDHVMYFHDGAQRPHRVLERNHGGQAVVSSLSWRGGQLMRVEHPQEAELRRYDDHQRLQQRRVKRPATAHSAAIRYTESFEYDTAHRLVRHHLPEGGSLGYEWHADGRLTNIHWHDVGGKSHVVIATNAGKAGYQYGNALRLVTLLDRDGRAGQLRLLRGDQPVWTTSTQYDGQGRLALEHHAVPDAKHDETWSYGYDTQGRLAVATRTRQDDNEAARDPPEPYWYAWHSDGSLAAKRVQGISMKPAIKRDVSGLPTSIGSRTLRFGANRRLQQVDEGNTVIAQYHHNAYGHRIVSHGPTGSQHFLYLDNRVVAQLPGHTRQAPDAVLGKTEADDQTPRLPVGRRYIYAHHTPVGFIDYIDGDSRQATLYFVHADLIGAPRLITDHQGKLRWLASYTPMGQAQRLAGDLDIDLRLPGQIFDAATGWHDNVLRTYLPEWGHYLEPDPLGPIPGSQALGYADQQPRRHVDPLGLLLFAFDGTRHSPQTQSNVWKLSQAYRDGPVYYHAGPGNSTSIDWDAATASSAPQIIENQWQSLLDVLHQSSNTGEHIPIDIIGYSRGAALARHFGNLINQHMTGTLFAFQDTLRGVISACVDLRFMGLFDTVAQFGLGGLNNAQYDLSISPAWEWVAHAVALHERRWLLPLTSAGDAHGHNVIEAPFIGAHADIGGGVLRGMSSGIHHQADLSDVALNWMLWQARAAALMFDLSDPADRQITHPVLHDDRSVAARSVQDGDRSVAFASGERQHAYQDDHARLGREQRAQTEALIQRLEDWRRQAGAAVGMVDMAGYARWLHDELGWGPISP